MRRLVLSWLLLLPKATTKFKKAIGSEMSTFCSINTSRRSIPQKLPHLIFNQTNSFTKRSLVNSPILD